MVVDVSAAVALVSNRLGSRSIALVVVVDSSQSYDELPWGRWPSEGMPCKLDGIVKSNSSPEAVHLAAFLPVPGSSVSYVRQCHKNPGNATAYSYLPVEPWNFCKFGTPVPQYPGYLEVP